MHTNTDITIYNKYFDKETRTDKYQRTVIQDVFWEERKAYNRLKSGLESADKVFVLIPLADISNRQYITRNAFRKVGSKENYFTLAEEDKIVRGEIYFEIEGKLSDLDKKYEAFTITSVDTHDYGSYYMRHWEVGAK